LDDGPANLITEAGKVPGRQAATCRTTLDDALAARANRLWPVTRILQTQWPGHRNSLVGKYLPRRRVMQMNATLGGAYVTRLGATTAVGLFAMASRDGITTAIASSVKGSSCATASGSSARYANAPIDGLPVAPPHCRTGRNSSAQPPFFGGEVDADPLPGRLGALLDSMLAAGLS
jgi:hypothetical protein